jgi:hypothetical protein
MRLLVEKVIINFSHPIGMRLSAMGGTRTIYARDQTPAKFKLGTIQGTKISLSFAAVFFVLRLSKPLRQNIPSAFVRVSPYLF